MSRADRSASKSAQAEKITRKPVDVGSVEIVATGEPIPVHRTSKLDTNPVAQAVKNATDETLYTINGEPGKTKAIVSVLRRAGGRYARGVNIHKEDDATGLVQFSTGKRRERKPKADGTPVDPNARRTVSPVAPKTMPRSGLIE